jgi:iron complex outermembrane receptor protein
VKESFGKSTLTSGSFGLIQQRLSGYSDAKTNLFSSYTLETEDLEPIVRKRKTVNLHGRQKLSSKGNLSFRNFYAKGFYSKFYQ